MSTRSTEGTLESPYRIPAPVKGETAHDDPRDSDPALLVMALIFVLASLLRASNPLFGRETFGAEPTLALMASLVVGSYVLRDGWARIARRWAGARAPRPPERPAKVVEEDAQR